MTAAALTFDRKTTMYGIVQRIKGRIGLAGEVFAEAFLDGQTYEINFYDAEGRVTEERTVDASQDSVSAVDAVEALMSLAYRSATERRAA